MIKACFAVNVPFPLPVLEFSTDEHYKILADDKGQKMVLFAPREWRGNGTASLPASAKIDAKNVLSPEAMASEVNGYPKGTVSHIYTTSNGRFDLKQFQEMVGYLADHVELVSPNELSMRALQRG